MQNSPLISIVTVCYNTISTIEETILSVLSQSYKNIEYIIIDGGSTDGTIDIIKKYADRLAYWASEPDKGIYDAMNKGITVAKGDYINFMNAGDTFYDSDVLQNIFTKDYPESCNVIYGKTLIHYRWGTYIVTPPQIETIRKQMCLCHQSVFVRGSKHKSLPFDLTYKLSADYHLLRTIYEQAPDSFVFYNGIISNYDCINGISSKQTEQLHSESTQIAKNKPFLSRIKHCIKQAAPSGIYRLYFLFNKRYKRVAEK